MNFIIKNTHWIKNNMKKIKRNESPFKFLLHLIKCKLVFIIGNILPSFLPLSMFKYKRHNYFLHYAPNQFSQVLYTYPNIIRYPDDEEFLKVYLKPNDNYIDIGANIGTTTLCATTAIIPNGLTLAYEAHPDTFTYLTRAILNNKKLIPQIITRNIALGNETGSVRFSTINNHDDINHVIEDGEAGPSSDSDHLKNKKGIIIEVPIRKLDSELTFDKISLIKIDVEGYELQVFNGAIKTLAKTDAIFFEIYDKNAEMFNYDTKEIIGLLSNSGFKIYKIDITNKSLKRLDIQSYIGSPHCENMIAVRNEADLCSRTEYKIIV